MEYPPQQSPLLLSSPYSPPLLPHSPYSFNTQTEGSSRSLEQQQSSTLLGYGQGTRNYKDDDDDHEKGSTTTPTTSHNNNNNNKQSFIKRHRKLLLTALLLLLLILVIAVAVPTSLSTKSKSELSAADRAAAEEEASSSKSKSKAAGIATSTSTAQPSPAPTPSGRPAWGGDGSTVYGTQGEQFTYRNSFGGFWTSVPFNNSARAQRYTKPLSEEWDYQGDRIRGVNLGGWLTIEPFIVPALFEPFNPDPSARGGTVVDEWTLCEALGANMSRVITEHYETFITEKDFAEIAAAGLNWIRLPVPYWIIETWDSEPFLANVGWTYFLRAVTWARKYGLRINLDLHAVPGSQNGYNHSSKLGTINFMAGVMGVANAQRTLDIIRTLTEFISQEEYRPVVPMFSVLNEPFGPSIGVDEMRHFYLETYNMVRSITGLGQGKGPFISFHDAFAPQNDVPDVDFSVARGGWNDFLPGMDRVSLDTHPYLCFSEPNNDPLSFQATKPCTYFSRKMNVTTDKFGYAIAGEWSLAINDCGKWLNSVGNGQRYDGSYYNPGTNNRPYAGVGSCDRWNNYLAYTQEMKDGLKDVAMAHMDAFRDYFFWTWKIGRSSQTGLVPNPFWSYQLGLEQGWVPTDPREAFGVCPSLVAAAGVQMPLYPAPPLQPWMTGGAGAGTILDQAMEAQFTAWPPASLGNLPVSNLPQFTPTGRIVTKSAATPTSFPEGYATATPGVGDGWFNQADTRGWYTAIEGCSYPPAWSAAGLPAPTARCTGAGGSRIKRSPSPAPLPSPTTPPAPLR